MKKVKIMLLSLALFAVVGGALAFKAKFSNDWCLATPYADATGFYCTHNVGGPVTTKECQVLDENVTTDNSNPAEPIISCTTLPVAGEDPCGILCPVLKTIKDNR